MNIGIVREIRPGESRVALTPAGVHALAGDGNQVFVETRAGAGASFSNEEFTRAGARIVYSHQEVYGRSDLVVKVAPPTEEELELVLPGQVLVSFLQLEVARDSMVRKLVEHHVTALGMENIQDENGHRPLQEAMSEIGGQLAVQVGAQYLRTESGGRGVLLGNIPGVPQALVVILGAGTFGRASVRAALGLGAQVIILDNEMGRLRKIYHEFGNRVVTFHSNPYNLERVLRIADVFIGAVMVKGERAPQVVRSYLVRMMKKGAVIVDASVDLGGCVETSRPTTIWNPVFTAEGVIHYCVPNMASMVARSASKAINNQLLNFVVSIAREGIQSVLRRHQGLRQGVYLLNGKVMQQSVAEIFRLPLHSLEEELGL